MWMGYSQTRHHLYSLCFKMIQEEIRANIHNHHRCIIIETDYAALGSAVWQHSGRLLTLLGLWDAESGGVTQTLPVNLPD